MTDEQKELKKLSQPLADYLYKYYHPHATIIITQANVEVVEGKISIPLEIKD